MTESGPPKLPEKPRMPGADIPFTRGAEQRARVESVPSPLRILQSPARVEGVVQEVKSDGTVRVAAPEGDVTLRLPATSQKTPITPGERVEIDLSAGKPPQEATIRPASTQTAPPARGEKAPDPPPRPAQTPVSVELGTAPKPTPSVPPTSAVPPPDSPQLAREYAVPEPGDLVRLLPLAPAQVLELARQTSPTATPAPPLAQSLSLPPLPIDFVEILSVRLSRFDVSNAPTPIGNAGETINNIANSTPGAKPSVPSEFQFYILQNKGAAPIGADGLSPAATLPLPLPLPRIGELLALAAPVPTAAGSAAGPAPQPPAVPSFAASSFALSPFEGSSFEPPLAVFLAAPAPGREGAPIFTLSPTLASPAATLPPLTVLGEAIAPLAFNLNTTAQAPEFTQDLSRPLTGPLDAIVTQVDPSPASPFAVRGTPPALLANLPATAIPATITGAIAGAGGQSLPVLTLLLPGAAFEQSFALQFPGLALPPGTHIGLIPQGPPTTPHLPHLAFPDLLTPAPWPAMQDLYQALAQAAPALAQNLARTLPSPASPAQFAGAALFFLAALRAGDFSGWLGERAAEALRSAGRGGAAARAGAEVSALGKAAAQPVPGEWRGFALPLFWQGEIHKASVHYRHDDGHKDDAPERKGGQTRFIFDLSLPRMGQVQIDGLMRAARLDLVVRSEQAFSGAMQADMRRTYVKGLESAGLSGELSFQSRPGQWVKILPGGGNLGVVA